MSDMPPPTPTDPDATGAHAPVDFVSAQHGPLAFTDFEIIREIGRGGMGIVYEAMQISLQRRVALKVLRGFDLLDPAARERFQREARTAAGLHHTHIVPVFAVGSEAGVDYFVMQLIDGHNLADRLRTSGPLAPDEVARIGLDAAEALAHAHERGIIHRDIKPSNLMVDHAGTLWLTDFGLARQTDQSALTITGGMVGTPRYMSPEQASGQGPLDPRTDLYSLGATLYELATGQPVHEGATAQEILHQIATEEVLPARQRRADLPRDLDTILLTCLHREPARRYADARALAEDCRAFLDGRAIRARRMGPVGRAVRWLRRQKRSAAVALMAGLLTLVVALGLPLLWRASAPWRLAQLSFTTDPTGPGLTAELLDVHGKAVLPPVNLPTREPLVVPAGDYQVRLSAPGRPAEHLFVHGERGSRRTWEVRLLGQAITGMAVESAGHFLLAPGACLTQNEETLLCHDPLTGARRWEQKGLPVRLDTRGQHEGVWLDMGPPPPAVDLDGDGTPDVLVPDRSMLTSVRFPNPLASLIALSGRTGAELWTWPRGVRTPPAQQRTFPSPGVPLGWPAVVPIDSDGVPDLVITLSPGIRGRHGLVALSGRTGETLWQFDSGLDTLHDQQPLGFPARLVTLRGRPTLVWPCGRRVLLVDARTGRPIHTPLRFTAAPLLEPECADLDGDGEPDLVALMPDGADHVVVEALSLTGRLRWRRPIEVVAWKGQTGAFGRVPRLRPPVLADLDGDGKAEVVVLSSGPPVANTEYLGHLALVVLAGTTGEPLWQYDLVHHAWMPALTGPRIVAGPDLDDDGGRELFVASLVGERSWWLLASPPYDHASTVLYVEALRGRDGGAIWRRRVPLEPTRGQRQLDALRWANPGGDGWPQLLVPHATEATALRTVFRFQASNGKSTGNLDGVAGLALTDANGDGLYETAVWQRASNERPGQLTLLPGEAPVVWRRAESCTTSGDLDGDGMRDLLRLKRSRTEGQTPDLLTAMSGRRGRILWQADVPAPASPAGFALAPVSRPGSTLPDLAVWEDTLHRLGLHALNARTGKRVWTQQLHRRSGVVVLSDSGPRLLAFHDADKPGILLACSAPLAKGTPQPQLALLSVDTGEAVWRRELPRLPLSLRQRLGLGHLDRPRPLAWSGEADLDGDGIRDLVYLDEVGDQTVVRGIAGRTGQPLWSDEPAGRGQFASWLHLVKDRGKPRLFFLDGDRALHLFDASGKQLARQTHFLIGEVRYALVAYGASTVLRLGDEQILLCAGLQERTGKQVLLVIGSDGQPRGVLGERPLHFSPIPLPLLAHDVDGDGREELIRVVGGQVHVFALDSRPGGRVEGRLLWQRSLQPGKRQALRLRAGRLVVAQDARVSWFDPRTGRRVAHCTGTGTFLDALEEEEGQPLVAAFSDAVQGTIVRRAIHAGSSPTGERIDTLTREPDPRRLRPLPWVPVAVGDRPLPARVSWWALLLALVAIVLAYRRQRPRRRRLLVLALLVVLVTAGLPAILLELPVRSRGLEELTSAVTTIVFLPIATVPLVMLVQYIIPRTRRWWWLVLWLLLAALVLLLVAFFLPALPRLQPGERYSWQGWFLLPVCACYLAGVVLVALAMLEPAMMFYGLGDTRFWPTYERLGWPRWFGVDPPPGYAPPRAKKGRRNLQGEP